MNVRQIGVCALFAAMTAAGCASTTPSYSSTAPYGTSAPYGTTASCYDCGTVTRIDVVSAGTSNVPNATGGVVGGIVGGIAGHELTKNSSKGTQNAATVAGVVGGAVAGNAIQNHAQANNTTYNLYVQMDNGTSTVVTQSGLSGIHEGSRVRVDSGRAVLQ